uniref:Protein kinase domain-containing protein n=1 Tax=Clastoptera arizonana TaxID=38151 RepID=A0A1B6CPF8_9HEMI
MATEKCGLQIDKNRVKRNHVSSYFETKEHYATKQKKYDYNNVDNIPSVDTPKQKKWLDNGLENFSKYYVLGKGGFGIVVKAQYKGKLLAVKVIPKLTTYTSTSLRNEENAVGLRHVNLIQVFKIIDTNHNFGILWNVGLALQYCHENNILHLDVTPKNILIKLPDFSSKLCDFGSSMNITRNCDQYQKLPKGTIQYISPESLQGKKVTEKSDVYSLGITMWHLMYEEMPYIGECAHTIAYKVVSQNFRPRTTKRIDNSNLVLLYKSCWQTNPAQRPSIVSFIDQIKRNISL